MHVHCGIVASQSHNITELLFYDITYFINNKTNTWYIIKFFSLHQMPMLHILTVFKTVLIYRKCLANNVQK